MSNSYIDYTTASLFVGQSAIQSHINDYGLRSTDVLYCIRQILVNNKHKSLKKITENGFRFLGHIL